jgi:hypothetical protein
VQNYLQIRNFLYLCQVLTLKNLVMIDTIKQYEQELWAEYVELRDAFGALDDATQKAFSQWMVMDELLTRLNLNDEK